MANKLCAGGCGRVVTNRARCVECERRHNATRNAARPQYRDGWPTLAKQAIAEHRQLHGDVCPGWDREAHVIDPAGWTCDHDVGPLCRSCNGRKGGTYDRERRRDSGG